MKYLFYSLYALTTIGVCLSGIFSQPVLMYLCMAVAILTVYAECLHFRPKWPEKGTENYTKIVHGMEEAIARGKEKYAEEQRKGKK